MKKALVILATFALIGFAASAAWATVAMVEINFFEPVDEGSPVSVSGGQTNIGGIEYGLSSGLLSGLSNPGFYALIMTEPRSSIVSDYVFLATTDTGYQAYFFSDEFNLPRNGSGVTVSTPTGPDTIFDFAGAADVYDDYAGHTLPPIEETGVRQGHIINADNNMIHINAMSDISDVPLPGTVLLLGSGLACLTTYARRKRQV
jgi:hypothetical protein